MFAEHCPRHGARVLLSPSRIEAIHNTPAGVVVTWRCWCGHVGRTDHRTVASPTPTPTPAPAPAPLRPCPMSEAC